MRVTKFLENAAEILIATAGSFLFQTTAIEANILKESPETYTFSEFGVSILGAALGLAIIKGLIKDLKAEQTEDSFLQFESKKPKIK